MLLPHIRSLFITYGPNGISRGVATIVFNKPNSANDALSQLNGLLVDKKPMKAGSQSLTS